MCSYLFDSNSLGSLYSCIHVELAMYVHFEKGIKSELLPGFLEWHIFVILIVSCISTIVAPSNLIITASTGMEVYNSP